MRDETGGSWLGVDVRDPAHADDLVKHAFDRHGRLDVIVANAGIGHAGDVSDMTAERVCDLVDINVRAPMLLARAALAPMLAQRSGALVFISSIAAGVLVPRESVYSATKAAVEAFAEPLREELLGTGITVSTVAPGVVDTRFFDDRGEPYERRFPRPVAPEVIAAAVARSIEDGRRHTVVPRWLASHRACARSRRALYRTLARRFG